MLFSLSSIRKIDGKGKGKSRDGGNHRHRKHSKQEGDLQPEQGSRDRRESCDQEPSQLKASKTRSEATLECIACTDDVGVSKIAKLSCDHAMCNNCLKRLFELSVKDPLHMPPKCCQAEAIPYYKVARLFDERFKTKWRSKLEEFSTIDRLYCPNKTCGVFISPKCIEREQNISMKVSTKNKLPIQKYLILCPKCHTKICCLCKRDYHKGNKCPIDEDEKAFNKKAVEEGWKVCHQCTAMVERVDGCNHLTCRCGAQFCSECAAKWKTCDCSLYGPEAMGILADAGGIDPAVLGFLDPGQEALNQNLMIPAHRQLPDEPPQFQYDDFPTDHDVVPHPVYRPARAARQMDAIFRGPVHPQPLHRTLLPFRPFDLVHHHPGPFAAPPNRQVQYPHDIAYQTPAEWNHPRTQESAGYVASRDQHFPDIGPTMHFTGPFRPRRELDGMNTGNNDTSSDQRRATHDTTLRPADDPFHFSHFQIDDDDDF